MPLSFSVHRKTDLYENGDAACVAPLFFYTQKTHPSLNALDGSFDNPRDTSSRSVCPFFCCLDPQFHGKLLQYGTASQKVNPWDSVNVRIFYSAFHTKLLQVLYTHFFKLRTKLHFFTAAKINAKQNNRRNIAEQEGRCNQNEYFPGLHSIIYSQS